MVTNSPSQTYVNKYGSTVSKGTTSFAEAMKTVGKPKTPTVVSVPKPMASTPKPVSISKPSSSTIRDPKTGRDVPLDSNMGRYIQEQQKAVSGPGKALIITPITKGERGTSTVYDVGKGVGAGRPQELGRIDLGILSTKGAQVGGVTRTDKGFGVDVLMPALEDTRQPLYGTMARKTDVIPMQKTALFDPKRDYGGMEIKTTTGSIILPKDVVVEVADDGSVAGYYDRSGNLIVGSQELVKLKEEQKRREVAGELASFSTMSAAPLMKYASKEEQYEKLGKEMDFSKLDSTMSIKNIGQKVQDIAVGGAGATAGAGFGWATTGALNKLGWGKSASLGLKGAGIGAQSYVAGKITQSIAEPEARLLMQAKFPGKAEYTQSELAAAQKYRDKLDEGIAVYRGAKQEILKEVTPKTAAGSVAKWWMGVPLAGTVTEKMMSKEAREAYEGEAQNRLAAFYRGAGVPERDIPDLVFATANESSLKGAAAFGGAVVQGVGGDIAAAKLLAPTMGLPAGTSIMQSFTKLSELGAGTLKGAGQRALILGSVGLGPGAAEAISGSAYARQSIGMPYPILPSTKMGFFDQGMILEGTRGAGSAAMFLAPIGAAMGVKVNVPDVGKGITQMISGKSTGGRGAREFPMMKSSILQFGAEKLGEYADFPQETLTNIAGSKVLVGGRGLPIFTTVPVSNAVFVPEFTSEVSVDEFKAPVFQAADTSVFADDIIFDNKTKIDETIDVPPPSDVPPPEDTEEKTSGDTYIDNRVDTDVDNIINQDIPEDVNTDLISDVVVPIGGGAIPFAPFPGLPSGFERRKGKRGMRSWTITNPMRDLAAEWEEQKFGMQSNLPLFLSGAAMFETQPFGGQPKQIEGITFDATSLNKKFKRMNRFFR